MKHTYSILLIALAGFLFMGCASTVTSLSPLGTSAFNQPASVSKIKTDGTVQEGVYQGLGGTNGVAGKDGINFTTPGTGSLVAKDGIYAWLPGDLKIDKLIYDPKTGRIELTDISVIKSKPIESLMPGVIASFDAIQNMTQEEAKVKLEAMLALGEITKSAFEFAMTYYVPKLPTVALPSIPSLPTAPAPAEPAAPDAPPPAAAIGAEPVLLADLTSERGI